VVPHAAAPSALTFGGSHGAQDAPSAALAVPAGHTTHDVLPREKVPPGHAEQDVGLEPLDDVPGGHGRHVEAPGKGWYEPAQHEEQVGADARAEKVPAAH